MANNLFSVCTHISMSVYQYRTDNILWSVNLLKSSGILWLQVNTSAIHNNCIFWLLGEMFWWHPSVHYKWDWIAGSCIIGCFDFLSLPCLWFEKSLNLLQDYEMSPYEDSDEEDIDTLEHKREIRHRRKLIPSWAE